MNRREVLRVAALAATSLTACARDISLVRESAVRTKKVIVVGAGLAGLVAGYELTRAGHDVLILEAQDRAGGRVHTVREPFPSGLYAEAGALFIPGNHDLVLKYVRDFNLSIRSTFPFAALRLFYVRGQRVVANPRATAIWPFDLTTEEQRLGYRGIWDKYIGAALDEVGDVTQPGWPGGSALANYDRLSMGEFLRSRGASPGAVALLRLGYLNVTGDGIESYSALHMLRDLAHRRHERQTFSISGGNDALPRALAERLTERIRYNAAVVQIAPGGRSAVVVVKRGGEYERLTADHVVCAIPFSVLRHTEVSPPLSPSKRRAIDELAYTSVARIYLQSRRRVWTEDNAYLSVTTDLPVAWLFDQTASQPGLGGILEAQAVGPDARRIGEMAEHDRIAFALRYAAEVFPELRGSFQLGVTKCWDDDPWARGAFAYFRPGQMQSLMPHIARAEGRVHFAGEHASAWPGWMQGALESGLRVVQEINT